MVTGRVKSWAEKLKRRNVVLFGAGQWARAFYQDFCGQYDFADCVSNAADESALTVDGRDVMEVHRPQSLKARKNLFIVVCVEQCRDILEQLRAMGYVYGRDFIESNVLRLLLSRKRIAVFYGVCYMRAIYTCLMESAGFCREFDAVYQLDYLRMDAGEEQLFFLLLGVCDVFLCNAFLSEAERRRTEIYKGRLPRDCIVISVPMLIFNGYYPCAAEEIGRDNVYGVTGITSPYAPFITPDREINKMIAAGKDVSEIIARVSAADYYERGYLIGNYEKEMRKLEIAETLSTVKICDYLYEKHGKERTFLNEKHISNIVVRELAQRVLECLGLQRDVPEAVCAVRLLYTSEVPVYPSVIETLGLEAYKGTTKLFTFAGDMELSFEEYVRVYVDYCSSMKKYIESGFFQSV